MQAENQTADFDGNELLLFFDRRISAEHKKKNRHRLYCELVITAAVIILLFKIIAGIAIVCGDSMNPSLSNGNVVLFYRLDNTYRRNDIVIFQHAGGNQLLIKRVVAIAGDKIDIDDKTGTLLVNGSSPKGPVEGGTYKRDSDIKYPFTVPDNCVFVLGDNREAALDSRSLGAIKTNSLLGKVFFEVRILSGGT
jgi:signal peptidase I